MDKYMLDKKDAAIVIVDIQERLAAAMSEKEKVVSNCLHLIEISKLLEIPLLLNEQYPKGLGPTVPEIKEAVSSYAPVEKVVFSCCRGDEFMDKLRAAGKKKVILTGMETHVCVLQTCVDLIGHGYAVHVVSDAVCSRAKQNHKTALEYMRDAGAAITCTETVLFQLLEKAGTDAFKSISKRIK